MNRELETKDPGSKIDLSNYHNCANSKNEDERTHPARHKPTKTKP
jgi:hypothetical protein